MRLAYGPPDKTRNPTWRILPCTVYTYTVLLAPRVPCAQRGTQAARTAPDMPASMQCHDDTYTQAELHSLLLTPKTFTCAVM